MPSGSCCSVVSATLGGSCAPSRRPEKLPRCDRSHAGAPPLFCGHRTRA